MPPWCKGRWIAIGETEGLFLYTIVLQDPAESRHNNPPPAIAGGPLYSTRGPPMPPRCKGRWIAIGETEGLFLYTIVLQDPAESRHNNPPPAIAGAPFTQGGLLGFAKGGSPGKFNKLLM